MNILKEQKFRAASWIETSKIVEGTLQVADFKTLDPADPKVNRNGYLMIIEDAEGLRHLIAPDTLEIIDNPFSSEMEKEMCSIINEMQKNGLLQSTIENFWKDCISAAKIMILLKQNK